MLPKNLSPQEAQGHLKSGAVLFDVREPDEWKEMHVEASTLIPLDDVADRAAEIPRDRDVILLCRSGRRSGLAQKKLETLGFDRVSNLTGGIIAWHDAGLPVVART